jgi:type IV pilus assembly protein PilQ
MSLKNILKHASQLVLLLSLSSYFSACATDDVKAEDENTASLSADLDNASTENKTSDNNLNPDLAKDTLGATSNDEPKIEDLDAPDSPLDTNKPALATQAPPVVPPPALEPTIAPPEASTETMATNNQEVEITNFKYNADRDGGTVIIETSGPATFQKREGASGRQMIVEIANARIPSRFLRPLVTKDFKQSIASVYAYQDRGSSTARFVIQMRDNSRPNIQQQGKSILIAAQNNSSSSDIAKTDAGISTFSSTNDKVKNQANEKDSSLRFYGKPINIEVRDTPIIDVLNFISEQSGANLLISNDVKGSITLKLKQVPWDQALLLVMKSQQLGYVREGSVLRIAPLDSLKNESDKAVKVLESQRDAEPLKVKIIPVSYAKVEELSPQLKDFLSKRGKVVADKRTSSVVITDIVENIERVTNLVKALDTPPYQVLIEGKVVEAGENFARDIGIQWGLGGGQIAAGSQTLTPSLNISPAPLGGSGANLAFTYGTFDALGSLTAALQLFEKESQIRVVSSPRIVTVNNEAASISQIVNIPVKTIVAGAAGQPPATSFSYTGIELSLQVTPQITAESDVIMQIDLKREFAANVPSNGDPPDINKRQAKTKVMVRNGQTAVIGGIYQSDNNITESGIPYLRSLPVVGWLFKQNSRSDKKNELLLFLTPRILNNEQGPKGGETL